jgi:signal transduction histidine kinase
MTAVTTQQGVAGLAPGDAPPRPRPARAPGLSEQERRWLWVTDVPFLVCALAALAWLPPLRPLDPLVCAGLVIAYAIACNMRIALSAGADAPCVQLVFVPMLFLAPLNLVPLLVLAALLIDDVWSCARTHRPAVRSVMALGNSWFALGPVLVLGATGHGEFAWSDAPLYFAALCAQLCITTLYAGGRERLLAGTWPRRGEIGLTNLIDVVLSVPALVAVAVAQQAPAGGVLMLAAVLTIAGGLTNERSARLDERERAAEDARRAVFDERVRIARELHDVVAHHVSVMGVQAGAARLMLARDPEQTRDALMSIETSSRQAVIELHRLLGFLRRAGDADDAGSYVGLAELEGLVSAMSASGLDVRVRVEGEQLALAPTVDVSAYRIVQEALTNTLKHATASRADVSLRYSPGELEIEVADDGRAGGAPSSAPGGMGLIGMRERAALHGGRLVAAPGARGGFVVRATLLTTGGAS